MSAGKVRDNTEVRRWFEQGKPYSWMIEEYRRKYDEETSKSMWGNYRRRQGLERRINRDASLIPWRVGPKHRWAYPVIMLRVEARRRRGDKLRPIDDQRLIAWLDGLKERDLVVHYDPEVEEGFFLIPRQPGDEDLIHEPEHRSRRPWDA